MNIVANLFKSSLGKKYIMAISGGALFLFVVGHLLGNLQIFLGPKAINRYGHFLQTNKEILWAVRFGLLGMVALHLWSAVKLSAENKAARPIGYADYPVPVLHYTVQVRSLNFTGQDFTALHDAEGQHDVFRMMVAGFSQPLVSGFYILATGLLCLHLSHGVSATFQSLGLKNEGCGPLIDRFARAAAWLIFLGYISIPIAVMLGYLK